MRDITRQLKAGWAAYHKKDFSRAIELSEMDLHESGERLHTLGHLAVCYKEKDELAKSVEYCERALSIDPEYYLAFKVLSEIHARRDDTERAYFFIQKALKYRPVMPKPPEIWSRIGGFLLKVFGLNKYQINELERIWYEPDDIEWVTWAQEFKARYEMNERITQHGSAPDSGQKAAFTRRPERYE